MNIKECYALFGGSYEDVESRISKEELIKKFVIKFIDDKTYENLSKEMDANNYEEAFKAVHTLKGLSQNLGFVRLGESTSQLTEFLRKKKNEEVDVDMCNTLWHQVKEDYGDVINAVSML